LCVTDLPHGYAQKDFEFQLELEAFSTGIIPLHGNR
jgi:hypothetical protein